MFIFKLAFTSKTTWSCVTRAQKKLKPDFYKAVAQSPLRFMDFYKAVAQSPLRFMVPLLYLALRECIKMRMKITNAELFALQRNFRQWAIKDEKPK